jgi:hypothetical protein
VGVAALAFLVFLVVVRRRDRSRQLETAGLTLVLNQDGAEVSRLRAPPGRSREFSFAVISSRGSSSQLVNADSGPRHRVRRLLDGRIEVRRPEGRPLYIPRNGSVPLGGGLALSFTDTRGVQPGPKPRRAPGTAGRRPQERRAGRGRDSTTGRSAGSGRRTAPSQARVDPSADQSYDDAF